jgi:hypothetical protein
VVLVSQVVMCLVDSISSSSVGIRVLGLRIGQKVKESLTPEIM